MEQDAIKPFTIGVDLGGTKVEVALVDAQGRVLSDIRYQTDVDRGPGAIISDLVDAINEVQKQAGHKAAALGIGAAGQIDSAGAVITAPNLPFHNEPLQDVLEKELGLPVIVTNDVNAATYGEWRFGSGKGRN